MKRRLGFNDYGVLEWVADPPHITAGAPATHQINFRVRDDTAAINTDSGWYAVEDTNPPSAIGTGTANRFRIRFTLDEVNNKVATCTPTLYANYNGGGYVRVDASSTYVQATASSQYADNAATTQLLSSGAAGTFLAGTADEVDGAVALLNFAKDQFTEVEFCVYFVDADVTDAHTCLFRVYNGTSALEGYTATPTITVSKSANVAVTVPVGSATTAGQIPTVTASDHQSVTVPVGSAAFTGNIPTVTATDHQPTGVAGSWTLSFNDDFPGTSIDTAKWKLEMPWGPSVDINNELQYYDPDEGDYVAQNDGLRITTDEVTASGKDYQSGVISTENLFEQEYGFYEISARLPDSTPGILPQIWLYAASNTWPHDGEIDLMEAPFAKTQFYMTNHWYDGANQGEGYEWDDGVDKSAAYHTYAVHWTAEYIRWYYDGELVAQQVNPDEIVPNAASTEPYTGMHLIINNAVGGDWPGAPDGGTTFPCYFDIEYVRAWTGTPTSEPSSYFEFGAEDADAQDYMSSVASSGNTVSKVSSPTPDSGSKCFEMAFAGTSADCYILRQGGADKDYRSFKFAIRRSSSYAAPAFNSLNAVALYGPNTTAGSGDLYGRIRIYNNDGTYELYAEKWFGGYGGGASMLTMAADTWYDVELRFYQHASAGYMEWWVDGTKEYEHTGLNSSAAGADRLLLGGHAGGSIPSAGSIYFDTIDSPFAVAAHPPVGAAVFTGYAPTATVAGSASVTVPTGTASVSGLVPDVAASANISVEIPVGSASTAGQIPTATASDRQSQEVPVGAAAFTGYAPTVAVTDFVIVTVPVGAAAFTGYAPTPAVTANVAQEVPVGSAAFTGYAPTVTASDHQAVTVPVGAAAFTGYAPGVSAGVGATVPVGSASFTGYAPTLDISVDAKPGVGSASFTGYAPTVDVTTNEVAEPGVGSVAFTGYTPTVDVAAGIEVEPGVGSVAFTGQVPTVDVSRSAEPGVGSVSFTGYAPSVSTGANIEVQPGVGSVSATGYIPAVAVTENVAVTVPIGAMTVAGYAPVVVASDHQNVEIPVGATLFTGLAPTADVSRSAAPGVGGLTLTGYTPTITTATAIEPDQWQVDAYIDSARSATAYIDVTRETVTYIDQARETEVER